MRIFFADAPARYPRINIDEVIARNPDVIFMVTEMESDRVQALWNTMDEPNSHLDITHQIKILDLVKSLSEKQGLTVVIILHDLNLASAYCDHIALMKDGKIFAKGPPAEVLTGEHIEEMYGTKVYIRNDPVVSKPHIFFIPGQFS